MRISTQTIRERLHTLKLFHMLSALDEQMALATKENLPPSQLVENLLAIETDQLIQRRIDRRSRDTKLPQRKLLADFDFELQTGVDKAGSWSSPPYPSSSAKRGSCWRENQAQAKATSPRHCCFWVARSSMAAATPALHRCSRS